MAVTGTGPERIRWPNMLGGRVGCLAGAVQSADFPPTDQRREVHGILRERLAVHQAELQRILESELPEANRALEGEGVPGGGPRPAGEYRAAVGLLTAARGAAGLQTGTAAVRRREARRFSTMRWTLTKAAIVPTEQWSGERWRTASDG